MNHSIPVVVRLLTEVVTWEWTVALLVRLTMILAIGQVAVMLLSRRAPAATRHLVALAALAAGLAIPVTNLLIPLGPALTVPDPVASLLPTPAREAITARPVPVPPHAVSDVSSGTSAQLLPQGSASETAGTPTRIVPGDSPPYAATEGRHGDRPAIPWGVVLAGILVVGAAAFLGRIAASVRAAHALCRGARVVADDDVRADIASVGARFSMRRPISVMTSHHVWVPVVAGFRRPVVLLPRSALMWSSERRRIVLAHEFAHISRHDGLALLFSRIGTALLWFHPLAWSLARTARRECERACDDVVLSVGVSASSYAHHLLAIARGASQHDRASEYTLAFGRRVRLEPRLRALLRAGVPRGRATKRTITAVALVTFAMVVPVASLRVVASPQSEFPAEQGAPLQVVAAPRWNDMASDEARRSAIATYDALADGCSEHASEWKEVALALLRSDAPALAADAFEREYDIDRCPGALYNSGCALAARGEFQRAVLMLERAILEGPALGNKLATDPDLFSLHGVPGFEHVFVLFDELSSVRGGARAASLWRRELPRFDHATTVSPHDGRAWSNLGAARLHAGDAAGSAAAFKRALELGYHPTAMMYNLARAAVRMKDGDLAMQWLRRSEIAGASVWHRAQCDPDLALIRSRVAEHDPALTTNRSLREGS